MILQQILLNISHYGSVVVVDDVYSRFYTPCLVQKALQQKQSLFIYLCQDYPIITLQKRYAQFSDDVIFHNVSELDSLNTLVATIESLIKQEADDENQQVTIIIDSITGMVLQHSLSKVQFFLNLLKSKLSASLLLIAHGDTCSNRNQLNSLLSHASCIVRLKDPLHLASGVAIDELTTDEFEQDSLVEQVRQKNVSDKTETSYLKAFIFSMRKSNAKLVFHKEYLKLGDARQGTLLDCSNPFEPFLKKREVAVAKQEQEAPPSDVPFKLSLSEQERDAKDKVVLPYMKVGREAQEAEQPKKQGLIVVDDEEAVDEDDDPDADLEI